MSLGQRELPFQARWRQHVGSRRWNDLTPYEQGLVFLAPYSDVTIQDAAIQVDLVKAHGDGLWNLMCIADAHLEARGLIDRAKWDDNRRHQFARILRGTEMGDRFADSVSHAWESKPYSPIDEGTLEHFSIEANYIDQTLFDEESIDSYLSTFLMLLCTEEYGGQEPSSGIDELVYRPEPKWSQRVFAFTHRQKVQLEISLHRRTHSRLEKERAITLEYLRRNGKDARDVLSKVRNPRRAAVILMRFAVQEELLKPTYYLVKNYPNPEAFPLLDTCLACLNTMLKLRMLSAPQKLYMVRALMNKFCGLPLER